MLRRQSVVQKFCRIKWALQQRTAMAAVNARFARAQYRLPGTAAVTKWPVLPVAGACMLSRKMVYAAARPHAPGGNRL